jgi:hypothetical protein
MRKAAQQHEEVMLERLVDEARPQDRIGLRRTAPRGLGNRSRLIGHVRWCR